MYRLSADEEDSAASNLENRSANDDVDMWLCILRHHALADDTRRTAHREPPAGSLHLPERVVAQEKLAVLRHVMSPSALRKTMSEEGRTTEEELASKLDGPGQVEDGVEWEDVADGVYLLIGHTQTKREGHTFKFRLRESSHNDSTYSTKLILEPTPILSSHTDVQCVLPIQTLLICRSDRAGQACGFSNGLRWQHQYDLLWRGAHRDRRSFVPR